MNIDSVKLFKCLADKSRLLIINNLRENPMYVELLSERLGLSPSTISFHLKKLEDVNLVYSVKEQYYVVYHINESLLSLKVLDLINVIEPETDIQTERELQYKQKVIDNFFDYEKLKSIPVQQKKKKIVLDKIAEEFQYDKDYLEKEVNEIIKKYHDDFCTIRRDMIGFKILTRENSIYRLVKKQ